MKIDVYEDALGRDYQVGYLSRAQLDHLLTNEVFYYDNFAAHTVLPEEQSYFRTIKGVLIVIAYSPAAYDYTVKKRAADALLGTLGPGDRPITINFKAAALLAGMGMRGYNTLVWSTRFAFDCKILAFGLSQKLDYRAPTLPEYLPICADCLLCHQNCPGRAFDLESEERFAPEKCSEIIGPPIRTEMAKNTDEENEEFLVRNF